LSDIRYKRVYCYLDLQTLKLQDDFGYLGKLQAN
jgi:hypothetical protein